MNNDSSTLFPRVQVKREHGMTQCLPKKSCLKQSNTEGSGRTTTAHKHDDSTALALTVIKEESPREKVKTESPKTTAVSKSAAEAPRSDITDLTSPPPPKRNAKISGNDKAQDSAAAASNQNDPISHVIFSLDCSGSIRERDVKSVGGNITPWGAVFKCVDSLIDEQVNQNGSDADTCCFVFPAAYNLAASGSERDKICVVFLTDGRPGDLQAKPPNSDEDMQKFAGCSKYKQLSAGHYISNIQSDHHYFDLQLICLFEEGKQWMKYLSTHFEDTLHNPDLSLDGEESDDEGIGVIPMEVKSSRTILPTVTAMRAKSRSEREVVIKSTSAMISYEATRMVLSDANGHKSFVIAPGEASNERKIQVYMHPFAQGGLRNVYRMKQSSTEANNAELAVAKESRHDIKYNERLKFHVETATNQLRAYKYAKSFRSALASKGADEENSVPPISVLKTEVTLKSSDMSWRVSVSLC
ncbi:hypothetical protein ACHAWO_006856 [Cyclotella atomus]|uniref:Alpha-type protein kinase domain-containing protein n=1 Tax=Cyclotella atomus TaxID=382360 RepID=A0ABD3NQM2_9STRA